MGIPPATEASNSKFTLFFSASFAKLFPCFAIKALLGVITCILFFRAVSTIFFDMPSDNPMHSNSTSIFLSLKRVTFLTSKNIFCPFFSEKITDENIEKNLNIEEKLGRKSLAFFWRFFILTFLSLLFVVEPRLNILEVILFNIFY